VTDDVTQSIDVDAPRERVWGLLTDPAELPRWWPDAAELEPRLGGRVVLTFGPGHVNGEVTHWEPPQALGFTWEATNMPGVRLHVLFTVDDLGDVPGSASSTPGSPLRPPRPATPWPTAGRTSCRGSPKPPERGDA
jgi:uncharacterized protein YndB with AHSA1/START domain